MAALDSFHCFYIDTRSVFVSSTSPLFQTRQIDKVWIPCYWRKTNTNPEFMPPFHTYHNMTLTAPRLRFNPSYSPARLQTRSI